METGPLAGGRWPTVNPRAYALRMALLGPDAYVPCRRRSRSRTPGPSSRSRFPRASFRGTQSRSLQRDPAIIFRSRGMALAIASRIFRGSARTIPSSSSCSTGLRSGPSSPKPNSQIFNKGPNQSIEVGQSPFICVRRGVENTGRRTALNRTFWAEPKRCFSAGSRPSRKPGQSIRQSS